VAEYGDYTAGPRVLDGQTGASMRAVLRDVVDGTFADRFITDQDAGAPEFQGIRARLEQHPIEQIGPVVRAMFQMTDRDDDYHGTAART
jgi:ketol-acid reductoisomerase